MNEETRNEKVANLGDIPVWGGASGRALGGDVFQKPESEETASESKEDDEVGDDESDRKVRIPRSRLKTLTDKINELEVQLQSATQSQERIAALEARLQPQQEDLPKEWVELHGDSEASKSLYRSTMDLSKREFRALMEQVEKEKQEELAQERARTAAIEASFDEQMADLESMAKRRFSDSQKAEIMDIVSKYSPRSASDPERYESYMSINNAYDIWSKTNKRDAGKDALARIASAGSSGENSGVSKDTNWDPRNWRSRYRDLGL